MNSGTRLERSMAERIVGRSERIRAIRRLVLRLAQSRIPVLITGESGTGKELVARALHEAGPRAGRPFVAENCAAVPEPLFESLLFGHVRGAFTGALRDHEGLFRRAEGGTLLLDEIGDLPLPLQARLLRVLQESEVRPVGAADTVPVDVRILAATNADLARRVAAGTFRADLFYRLHGIVVELPALRLRLEDIPPLTEAFLSRLTPPRRGRRWRLDPAAMRSLVDYEWPGNVRELAGEIERAAALTDGPRITPDLFSPSLRHSAPPPEGSESQPRLPLLGVARHPARVDPAEKRMIERALLVARGRISLAAVEIGWNRQKLYRRMSELGISSGFARREARDERIDDDARETRPKKKSRAGCG